MPYVLTILAILVVLSFIEHTFMVYTEYPAQVVDIQKEQWVDHAFGHEHDSKVLIVEIVINGQAVQKRAQLRNESSDQVPRIGEKVQVCVSRGFLSRMIWNVSV